MSADNAIVVLRTRRNAGDGFEYRLAEYGVSGEPFEREHETDLTSAKQRSGELVAESMLRGEEIVDDGPNFRIVEGAVAIRFHDAQHFAAMFAQSPVTANLDAALEMADVIEHDSYVEYGTEVACIDLTWDELLAQAETVRQRRLMCKVMGPNAEADDAFSLERDDFKYLGGPGIERRLEDWQWPEEVVAEVMKLVEAKYFAWKEYRNAENLRIARVGNAAEVARYEQTRGSGCCQTHDEELCVHTLLGDVRVLFGFNHGH